MKLQTRGCWLVCLVFFLACQESIIDTDYSAAHQSMLTRLKSISDSYDPQANIYANSQRANLFLDHSSSQQGLEKIKNLGLYGQELLYAGHTETAIAILDSVSQLLQESEDKDIEFDKALQSVRSIGWLRLGEQRNCILNHSHQSCIVPIQAAGIHQDRTGSEKAIELFIKELEQTPDDYTLIWLLNLAFMTLGEYPDKVPEQYLIPTKAFQAEPQLLEPFPEVATQLGIDHTGLSGGSVVEDFNNDGLFDIAASSWGSEDQLKIYFQDGAGGFQDMTEKLGLSGITGGLNLMQADYDNDGFVDLLVLRGAWMGVDGRQPNSLLKNMNGEKFYDVTEPAGLLSFHPTQTASWADFDLDGDLDLFIGNESTPGCSNACELFENKGDGSFENVASALKVDVKDFIKGAVWGDVNNDRYPDLYLSNLNGKNFLFRNDGPGENNQVTFTEIAAIAGVQEPLTSFPSWFFDVNQDGWEDIFVSGYQADAGAFARELLGEKLNCELPKIYLNNQDETFTDATSKYQMDKVLYSMGSNYGDLNNDNFPDFYIGTGDPDFRAVIPNRMFLNRQGKTFTEVTYQGRFGHIQKGHGVSFADLDRDGDQDLFTVLGGALEGDVYQNALFQNPRKNNHWVSLMLVGEQSNRNAVGARVKLALGDGSVYWQTVSSGGSFGCNPFEIFWGLPSKDEKFEIEIFWPRGQGAVQVLSELVSNTAYQVYENGSTTAMDLKEVIWKPNGEHHHAH